MPEITVQSNEPAPEKQVVVPTEQPLNLRPDRQFRLPDGRVVTMGKPMEPTATLMPAVIASMMDPQSKDRPDMVSIQSQTINAKIAMFVRSIDSKPFRSPLSMAEVHLIFRELGEDGCDVVTDAYYRHFAPLSSEQLEIIKK